MNRFHFTRFVRGLFPDRSETLSLFWVKELGIRRFISGTPECVRDVYTATRHNPHPDRNRYIH